MRLLRFRFNLWRMMITVAIVALVLAVKDGRGRRDSYLHQARLGSGEQLSTVFSGSRPIANLRDVALDLLEQE